MPTASEFIAAARAEIGYTENPPGSNRTKYAAMAGHPNGYAWCRTFVVAIARRVGLALPNESAWTPSAADGYKRAGRWHTGDPQPGDEGFIDFPGDDKDRIQHTVIVVSSNGRSVATIEGNTSSDTRGSQDNGGGVDARKRDRSLFVGFGRPAFTAPPPTPVQKAKDDPMALLFGDRTGKDPGQVLETGSELFMLGDGEDSTALREAGVKLVKVSKGLHDRLKAKADK